MPKRILATLAAALFILTAGLHAQETRPTQPPAEKPAATPPEAAAREESRRPDPPNRGNVKLDLTITDQAAAGQAVKRHVSMIVADRHNGMIRSGGNVVVAGNRIPVTLNVDAAPHILGDNRILLELGLEYAPKPVSESATTGEGRASLTERIGLIVEPGKPVILSQASDPTSDRRITVELTATILK